MAFWHDILVTIYVGPLLILPMSWCEPYIALAGLSISVIFYRAVYRLSLVTLQAQHPHMNQNTNRAISILYGFVVSYISCGIVISLSSIIIQISPSIERCHS